MIQQIDRVTFPVDEGSGEGYLALPDGPGPYRAVVVIQEWWGLNDHIKDVARRFAAEGYVALAPDLYHGAVTEEPNEARKLAMELQLDAAARELSAAAAYLAARSDVAPNKVGVVGFCLGGSLALLLGAVSSDIGAVAAFYGGIDPGGEAGARLRKIGAPVLAIYGSEDQGIPAERRMKLGQILTEIGVPHEIVVYEGAQHAFFNDTRPQAYHPEAAADAWRRTLKWFDSYLK